MDRPQQWPVHSSWDLYRGSAPFAVRMDTISRPAHPEETFSRLVVEHPGAVVVVAIDELDRVLCLEQYRHPGGRRFVEVPAGLLDSVDEDPLEAARRELLEEGAVTASQWRHLNTIHTSPGILSERIDIFVATGLATAADRGGFELKHEEADMEIRWIAFDALVEAVLERRITDGPLATAVMTEALLRERRARQISAEE